jgi:hypothetical protein
LRIKDQGTVGALSKDIGEAMVMLDKNLEKHREVVLNPQGSVTLKFKVTGLSNVTA